MENTELAEKRLKIITGSSKCWLEAQFIRKYILEPEPSIQWNSGLPLLQVPEYCNRVHMHGGRVLGFHASMDSPYPLFCIPWERFGMEYNPEWISLAMEYYQKNKVDFNIVPTCDFEYSVLKRFLAEK